MREFADQSSNTAVSCNLFHFQDANNSEVHDHKHANDIELESGEWSKARLPSNKLASVQLKNAAIAFIAHDDQHQNIRADRGPFDIQSMPTSSSSRSSDTPPTLKFGMYAGRVKANPLKYLATLLRSKIQSQLEACNLLEIATEIHDEAKNKHNTTLRRIYDVVNVMEAAGLLERMNGNSHSKRLRASNRKCAGPSNPQAKCSKLAFAEGSQEQMEGFFRNRIMQSRKGDVVGKRSVRGSKIRWLGYRPEYEERHRNRVILDQVSKEKRAAAERISEKQCQFKFLQEELRLTMELIKHNQNRHLECFESNMIPSTPPPEEDCYLNLEAQSQMSETECTTQPHGLHGPCGFESSHVVPTSGQPELSNPPMMSVTKEDFDCWYQSVDEIEMNSLQPADQYQSNGLPLAHYVATTGSAEIGLHVPFVILQTNSATNVEIQLERNEMSEVHIALDNGYELFDYRELLSNMFPRNEGEIHVSRDPFP